MSNSRVSKSDAILRRLAGSPVCSLTPDGTSFIKQRFDPYHDTPFRPVGYPDDFDGFTVSRCIKRTVTVSQTSGGKAATTSPWDMSITFTPLLVNTKVQACESNGNTFSFDPINPGPAKNYGGLMIQGNNTSGSEFEYPVTVANATQSILGQIFIPDTDLSNNMRVVAAGFEVIDGTADLYKQGILTCYRQNQPTTDPRFYHGMGTSLVAGDITNCDTDVKIVKMPPTTTGAALLIPSSKQWLVKEGAYVSVDFNDSTLPMVPPSPFTVGLISDSTPVTVGFNDTMTYVGIDPTNQFSRAIGGTTPPSFIRDYAAPTTRMMPINQSGIFLSGLNPLATITVNAIFYVECAPDGEDEELLTLATESPSKDEFSLMIVSELRRDSPVAVKLYENYMGEWFVDGIKDIISTVTPWLSNAVHIGKTVSGWADEAKANNGVLGLNSKVASPQSMIRGPAVKKAIKEKPPSSKHIPKAPGPMPTKAAFRKTTVKVPVTYRNNEAYLRDRIKRRTEDPRYYTADGNRIPTKEEYLAERNRRKPGYRRRR